MAKNTEREKKRRNNNTHIILNHQQRLRWLFLLKSVVVSLGLLILPIVGITIGTVILPGIGTAIGGTIGTALSAEFLGIGISHKAYSTKTRQGLAIAGGIAVVISAFAITGGLLGSFAFPGVGTAFGIGIGVTIGATVGAVSMGISLCILGGAKLIDFCHKRWKKSTNRRHRNDSPVIASNAPLVSQDQKYSVKKIRSRSMTVEGALPSGKKSETPIQRLEFVLTRYLLNINGGTHEDQLVDLLWQALSEHDNNEGTDDRIENINGLLGNVQLNQFFTRHCVEQLEKRFTTLQIALSKNDVYQALETQLMRKQAITAEKYQTVMERHSHMFEQTQLDSLESHTNEQRVANLELISNEPTVDHEIIDKLIKVTLKELIEEIKTIPEAEQKRDSHLKHFQIIACLHQFIVNKCYDLEVSHNDIGTSPQTNLNIPQSDDNLEWGSASNFFVSKSSSSSSTVINKHCSLTY